MRATTSKNLTIKEAKLSSKLQGSGQASLAQENPPVSGAQTLPSPLSQRTRLVTSSGNSDQSRSKLRLPFNIEQLRLARLISAKTVHRAAGREHVRPTNKRGALSQLLFQDEESELSASDSSSAPSRLPDVSQGALGQTFLGQQVRQ